MPTINAYKIAEKKIEKARKEGAVVLDLSQKGGGENELVLHELPESVSQLVELEELRLSYNKLTTLPEWIGELSQLKSIKLSGNALAHVPEALRNLKKLEHLQLSGNKLASIPEWIGDLPKLKSINLSDNQIIRLPESIGKIEHLEDLRIACNKLIDLPESLSQLRKLKILWLGSNKLDQPPRVIAKIPSLLDLAIGGNEFTELPTWFGDLVNLRVLWLGYNGVDSKINTLPQCIRKLRDLRVLAMGYTLLDSLPDWISELDRLEELKLQDNKLTDLPASLSKIESLKKIYMDGNPLNPELAAANKEGADAVKRYLLAKNEAQVILNEAKLILIGEGEVGKSSLLGALRGDPWEDGRLSTHGIVIKPIKVNDVTTGTEITLNGWDFGGQRVYRPTHQLFFSAPAIYLVIWKPREGSQQGFVKEWIKLVKHREPDARILVVATYGGPKERQPDIDRQEIWDLFGRETVVDFFHIESRPPILDQKTGKRTGECTGISELKNSIARIATMLPEVGRSVPMHWQEARKALIRNKEAFLHISQVLAICKEHNIQEPEARLLLRICRRVGDLIYYEHDPILREIVVLKPDWLATAISFVLDDKYTREVGHGLITYTKLAQLWDDPERETENRYSTALHSIFLRLMERFDLSYRVAETEKTEVEYSTSLIAQLVPDVRPEPVPGWPNTAAQGDEQQVQICRMVDAKNNQPATAEGIFFQLIVRFHKYSMGRANHSLSVHWQRGLVLEDDTGARAFLEHIENSVRITVRSPYPQRFLAALTYEIKWLVESFWTGLRCEVTVPCLNKWEDGKACGGLFEVGKLIENKKRNRPEQPCPICNEWQGIEQLLHNAPAGRPNPLEELQANSQEAIKVLQEVRRQLNEQQNQIIGRFDQLDAHSKETVSKVEEAYTRLIQTVVSEAKEGPRLFSFEPVNPGFFDRPKWVSAKFRVTLWCEHARLPLTALNGAGDKRGVYELSLPRDWFVKSAPFLKLLTGTLSLIIPVSSSATKTLLDDTTYQGIAKQLDLGEKSLTSAIKSAESAGTWLGQNDALNIEQGDAIEAHGAVLRQIQSWLKEKDVSYGGLVRVQNKRQEFLWVHPKFEIEY